MCVCVCVCVRERRGEEGGRVGGRGNHNTGECANVHSGIFTLYIAYSQNSEGI